MKFILLSVLLVPLAVNCREKMIVSSIPKSGTHLINKMFYLMLNESTPCFGNYYQDILTKIGSNKPYVEYGGKLFQRSYMSCHMPYSKSASLKIKQSGYKGIFTYRDPRDLVCSLVFWMNKVPHEWKALIPLSIEDRIKAVISGDQVDVLYPFLGEDSGSTNILKLFNMFLPWLNDSNFYAVRFEDLIGAKGGGSASVQRRVIKEISTHIGIECSEEHLQSIVDNLFGNTKTFRAGQIGNWKNHFTEEHKRLFKENSGQLLIDLGYEKDLDW